MAVAYGRFSDDGAEYIIDQPFAPPRAQINFLWNDAIISGLNQFGTGDGVFNNQTLTLNHPAGRVRMVRDGRRYFYLKDLASGMIWNAGLYPIRPKGAQLITHVGLGYSIFKTIYEGISVTNTCYLAPDEPVEIWQFEITNGSDETRRLWLVPYVEWLLGGYSVFGSPYSYLRSTFDADRRAVLSLNTSDERPHDRYNAFVATDGQVVGWCGGPRDFLGPYGTVTEPRSLTTGVMSCREAWCEELAGALAIELELRPGESRETTILLGSFDNDDEKNRLIDKVMPAAYRRDAWHALRRSKKTMIDCVRVETPDDRINRLVNVWAKQQIQLCVEFGRDGARGFRDTLQDAWGILPFNAPLAAAKIKETLAHQHRDGHGVRGWLPLQPHHYSDGPAWIAPVVTAYLKETGERSFLDEQVPYLDGGFGTVLEHMLQGNRHLSEDTGVHGLVLAHEGDWNDSLNWMGRAGRGESVWTSMALYYSLGAVAELAEQLLEDDAIAEEMRDRASQIRSAIDAHAWDGQWYLAGYSDFGNPVGAASNEQGRVFLNTQTWAILTGIAEGERREACLRTIDGVLESQHGSLTLWPSFIRRDQNVGRVTMLLPGMYENGTPYCHGTAFKIVSDLAIGRADEALRSFRKVMPDNESHPSIISGCEPYAFTNQYLGPDNARAGASISGWITGTAGWMFRAMTEGFCGVRPEYAGFRIVPCLPTEWPEVRMTRCFRGGRTRVIHMTRQGKEYMILVDGQRHEAGAMISY